MIRAMNLNRNLYKYPLLLGLMLLVAASQADAGDEELPLWELGLGGGVFSLPQYMGSDERYTIPFVFPYLIYRGEHWRADRDGLRNRLFDSDTFSLEVSLSGGLPVRNDNRARLGMPELYLTGEVGPKVNWYITETAHDSWVAHLPLRAAVNVQGDYVGWVTDPKLSYNYHMPTRDGVFRRGFDLGVHYSSARYHQTYYGVEAVNATAIRPAYQARAGFHSVYFKAKVRYSYEKNLDLFAAIQARTLVGGVVEDSPLVKNNFYGTIGVGAIWIFSTSEERVLRAD